MISGWSATPGCGASHALAGALPVARLQELPGAGHVTYAERPDEFAPAVARCVDEVTA